MKSKKGITLIALILTIIIMTILAGISMTALFGDNGIISNAMKSKIQNENEAAKELLELAWSARLSKYYEDLALGKRNTYESYFLKDDLNRELGKNGQISKITIREGNSFEVIYKDEQGNCYQFIVSKEGKADLIADHVKIEEEDEEEVVQIATYGMRVPTGVTQISDVEVQDNWKIFYIDAEKVYLIYGDYFPNAAIKNISESDDHTLGVWVRKSGSYTITFDEIIAGKNGKIRYFANVPSNWDNISEALSGSDSVFEGKTIDAVGTPSLEMWIDSWNELYSDHLGYRQVARNEEFLYLDENGEAATENAYREGFIVTTDTTEDPIYYAYDIGYWDFEEKEGYLAGTTEEDDNEYSDNMYFPHKGGFPWNWSYGYYLSTGYSGGLYTLYAVDRTGAISDDYYFYGIRPVISMTRSDFQDATGIVINK